MDREYLLKQYESSPVCREPDIFVLYRIIGNDLYPRHRKGQSYENLKFILEHEARLKDCEKRFVVNRIVDPQEEERILKRLDQAGAAYIHIPFRWEEYTAISWDAAGVLVEYAPYSRRFRALGKEQRSRILMRLYRYKNNYVMNNNGARNAALREGRCIAKWILPWDGNCFVTEHGWEEIRQSITAQPEIPFYIVPMARITENAVLLDRGFRPPAQEEPQIMFRRDTTLEFDPEYYYGRRPKVELLWRLGVSGIWDSWTLDPWDLPCPDYSEHAGGFGYAGWVARLFSGQAFLERDGDPSVLSDRGLARAKAIAGLIDTLDEERLRRHLNTSRPMFINGMGSQDGRGSAVPESRQHDVRGLLRQLKEAADEALSRGPYSVLDKTTLPPSGDPNDYWHPAPYYWPNPLPIPGLPYVHRDGRRVPGTVLYEALSERYDRTSLQRLFDDTFILSLAYVKHEEASYAQHAVKLVRSWFLDPRTAMTPHLEYAQVRKGRNKNRGSSSGIIEMKDVYYFLDAVRILQAAGALSEDEQARLKAWFQKYLQWLVASPQGQQERAAGNNHGTYYDLQVISIAAYLRDYRLVRDTLRDSRLRITQQFDADGTQLEEMKRTITAHYCCFNLQGWIHLAELAGRCGEDLWSYEGADGQSVRRAILWLLPHIGRKWPYQQIEEFDSERMVPIYYSYRKYCGEPPGVNTDIIPSVSDIKPLFHPHDGIRPFWQIQ